jgi:FkbM family methyltransferase
MIPEMRRDSEMRAQSLADLGYRAVRKAVRKTRAALDPVHFRRWKRQVLFPLRNSLLNSRPITVGANGERFLMVPEGAIAADFWSHLRFETHELAFLRSMLEPGMTFVDVGANVGLFTVPAARKLGMGKVFACEPSGWTYERLIRNLKLNGIENAVAVRTALGNATHEDRLKLNAPGKDGLNTLGKPTHPDCEVTGEETVPVTTLDEFAERRGVAKVDAMKVDVEGAELLVFQGGERLLKRADAPLILYEAYGCRSKGFGYNPVELAWLLKKWGFSIFTLNSETGRIREAAVSRPYDSMVIAVKAEHQQFEKVRRLAA